MCPLQTSARSLAGSLPPPTCPGREDRSGMQPAREPPRQKSPSPPQPAGERSKRGIPLVARGHQRGISSTASPLLQRRRPDPFLPLRLQVAAALRPLPVLTVLRRGSRPWPPLAAARRRSPSKRRPAPATPIPDLLSAWLAAERRTTNLLSSQWLLPPHQAPARLLANRGTGFAPATQYSSKRGCLGPAFDPPDQSEPCG